MTYPVHYVPAGDVLPIMFSTYDGGTGASLTMTGLAVSDVEIYKDGSVTQRASDAGYTLLDTDGIDFDGITGIHGFSIDTGDNTDASFYTVGAWFHVVVSAVTVDAQTVNFIAAAFRIMPAESSAGVPKVDLTHVGGATTDVSALATNVAAILVDTGTTLQGELDGIQADTEDIQTRLPAALVGGRIDATVDGTGMEAGAVTAIQSGLATSAALATVDGIVDNLVSGIIFGAAATGTLSTTQATTDLTGYADDQLIGRVVIFLSGACEGEASDITDYANTGGLLTFTALTTAPGNGDTFKIV